MFCQKTQTHSSLLEPFKNFFIEDLCVAEKARGQKIGQKLYDFAVELAKKEGCHNLTLDVWDDNQAAKAFYEKQGLQAQKT
ncbi:GNAT family N-acetyltransferase, partial [Streptococcus pyogenes]